MQLQKVSEVEQNWITRTRLGESRRDLISLLNDYHEVQLNWIRMMTDGNERNTTRDYVTPQPSEAMSKLVSAHPTLRHL